MQTMGTQSDHPWSFQMEILISHVFVGRFSLWCVDVSCVFYDVVRNLLFLHYKMERCWYLRRAWLIFRSKSCLCLILDLKNFPDFCLVFDPLSEISSSPLGSVSEFLHWFWIIRHRKFNFGYLVCDQPRYINRRFS